MPSDIETHLESSLALDSDEDGTLLSFGVLGVKRKVGATHDTNNNLSVFQQSEADGVLSTAEETLGAVDRVERPVTCSELRSASASSSTPQAVPKM